MANLKGSPLAGVVTERAEMTPATPGHASQFNAWWLLLLNNDAWLQEQVGLLLSRGSESVSIAEVLGLQDALDGKASIGHGHAYAVADIAGLRAELDSLYQRVHDLEVAGGGTGAGGSGGGGSVNFPLQINVTATDRLSDTPYRTTATASASSSAGAVVGYAWSWSGGGSAAGTPATLDFGGAGTYLVTCTATDAAGNTATASTTLVVQAAAETQTLTLAPDQVAVYQVGSNGEDLPPSTEAGDAAGYTQYAGSGAARRVARIPLSGLPAGARVLTRRLTATVSADVSDSPEGPVYYSSSTPRIQLLAGSSALAGDLASGEYLMGKYSNLATDSGPFAADLAVPSLPPSLYVTVLPVDFYPSGSEGRVTLSAASPRLIITYKV